MLGPTYIYILYGPIPFLLLQINSFYFTAIQKSILLCVMVIYMMLINWNEAYLRVTNVPYYPTRTRKLLYFRGQSSYFLLSKKKSSVMRMLP